VTGAETTGADVTGAETTTTPPPLLRPIWRHGRFWLVFAVVVGLGALIVAALSQPSGRPLDPTSASKNGAKALAVLLAQRGTSVHRSTSLADVAGTPAGTTVLVSFPDDYSTSQLRQLAASGHRVVLAGPGSNSAAAVMPGTSVTTADPVAVTADPGCGLPAATAAGPVRFPAGTAHYAAPPAAASCYDGRILSSDRLVIIPVGILRNDTLADPGVAALALNLLSDDGAVTDILWFLPGTEAHGPGPSSVWQLFPDGARRAAGWALVVGLLLVLWRARRLGPVVSEQLPAVVRAAEVVEGHGRLYRRAGARDRAAAALRAATLRRLIAHFGLDRHSSPAVVAAVTAGTTQRPAAELVSVLAGPVPGDDEQLLRLAAALDDVEARVGLPSRDAAATERSRR
jgi:Domain of unknown function (DUF4350)